MVACWGEMAISMVFTLHQVDVRGTIDQCHYPGGTQALGQHGGKNIVLIIIGHGTEYIRVLDILLQQQTLIRRVSMQHDGHFESLGNLSCPHLIVFDELDPVLLFQG